MPAPVFTQVIYLSPWFPLPPGWSKVGVDAAVSPPNGTGLSLAGRLRQGSTPLTVGVDISATEVVLLPPAPLATTLSYFVDVQWVPAGTAPNSVDWSVPDVIATAPVLTSVVIATAAQVQGATVQVAWDFGATALTPAGVNITAFASTGKSAGFNRVAGTSGTLALNSLADAGSQLYLQGVLPISGTPGTGFAAPFTMGPIVSSYPLPLAVPTVTGVQYDGGAVQVTWTAPAAPATGGAIAYDLIVSTGGAAAATTVFPAGANGGIAVLGPANANGWAVAGRVRVGSVIGPSGGVTPVLTQSPVVDQIAVAAGAAGVSARVTFPSGAPAAATALAELLQGSRVVANATASTSGATVNIVAPGVTGTGWAVRARLQQSGAVTLEGPIGAAVPVLATAPAIRQIDMTANPDGSGGWLLAVEVTDAPAPGTALLVTVTQNSVTVATQTVSNGTRAQFAFTQGAPAAGVIDGTTAATASVSINSLTATSPTAQAIFIGAAPTVTAVQNIGPADVSGLPQGLQVDVAAGGATGQVLTLRLWAANQIVATATGATATHANLALAEPLDPSRPWWLTARWSGAGVTDTTYGGWCAPVAVLTATSSVVRADYDSGQVAVTLQAPEGVVPAQSAYAYGYDTVSKLISGAAFTGTRGVFPLTPGSDSWEVGVKPFQSLPSGVDNRSLAPSSAPAPLLITAPTLAALSYDGDTLSANWNVVSDGAGNPATAGLLEVTGASGTWGAQEVGSASGAIAVQLPAALQGQITVRVRAIRSTAACETRGAFGAAVAPLIAAPIIGNVTLGSDAHGNPTVNALITPPPAVPAGTAYNAWLLLDERVVAGPVAADAGNAVSLPYSAAGVTGLEVVAQASLPGPPALQGPRSAPVAVLSVAPALTAVVIAPASVANTWQLQAAWQPPTAAPGINAYTLALTQNGAGTPVVTATFGTAQSGTLAFLYSAIDTTKTYTLTLLASAANGSASPLDSVPVQFSAPLFTAVTNSATQVVAQWTAPPLAPPTGTSLRYRLRLLDMASSSVLAATESSATSAGIRIDLLRLRSTGSYALALEVLLGSVAFSPALDGTPATQPALLLLQPQGLRVTTDAVTGNATVTWTGVSNATGYTVFFSDGRATADVSTNTYLFPGPLPAGAYVAVTVVAHILASGVVRTGPACDPLAVPTLLPKLLAADYDGINVHASWEPVADGVGYVVSVITATVITQSAQVVGTRVSFAAALDPSQGPYAVVVQAVSPTGVGLPSAALPLFQTAWFVSTAPPATAPPYLFPAATLARTAATISIYLPPLGNGPITVNPVGAFNLQANTDPTSKTALPYLLSFAATSSVWAFNSGNAPAPSIRPQLKTDYVNFLLAAETAGASAWGVSVLQQAIARWMPQTFAESHYYAYGLDLSGGPGTGSLDLRPGLVLRVNSGAYTNVWSGDSNSWLNGFSGGAAVDFDVSDGVAGNGSWQLTLDAFIANLTAAGVMSVAPPASLIAASKTAGVADAADLFFNGFPQPFYRLFFPSQLLDATGTGAVTPAANFALASAASYTALGAASRLPSATAPVVYFRGRAVLRLMIRISVNDVEMVIPLGTTVGNVLDRYAARPPSTALHLTGVTLERATGPAVAVFGDSPVAPPLVYDCTAGQRVRLDWATLATYGGALDATSLPLLHGDRMSF